jgi:hypothetical protein
MLQPKKGFENTQIEYKLGQVGIKINVTDITYAHIEQAKRYNIDLGFYIEESVQVPEQLLNIQTPSEAYEPEKHDIETVIQKAINKPKKTRTKKRS